MSFAVQGLSKRSSLTYRVAVLEAPGLVEVVVDCLGLSASQFFLKISL